MTRCPRHFEVEALRDGRLTGAQRTGFEHHLTRCASCASEARALDALGDALRAGEAPEPDELTVRRERTRLLAAFDRRLLARGREAGRRARLVLAAAAALVAVFVAIGAWLGGREPSSTLATPVQAAIEGDPTAVWSRRTEADREVVVLERGELSIRVARAPGARALLVRLPDGELEDEGTIFSVAVNAGRTTRVAVEEGGVLLRIRGRPPRAVRAGQTWASTPVVATSASPSRVASNASTFGTSTAALRASPANGLAGSASAPPPPPAVASAASVAFRAALTALNGGHNREAARQFARFVARYPGDSRAEDAAYLRVLALRRAGDAASMRAAAEEYLSRYRGGLRRNEIEALAR